MTRISVAALVAAGLAVVAHPVPGPSQTSYEGTYHPCPATLYSTVRVPIRVNNVGLGRFTAYPPQKNLTGKVYRVRFTPVIYGTAKIGGSTWAAEGPYWAECFNLFGGAHAVKPVTDKTGAALFEGTVWRVQDGTTCSDHESATYVLEPVEPSDDTNCGSGGESWDGSDSHCTSVWICVWVYHNGELVDEWCETTTVCD